MGWRNELGFNYLSLLLTDGHELNPDHRMLFSTAEQRLWLTLLAKKHLQFNSRCQIAGQMNCVVTLSWLTAAQRRKFPFTDKVKSNGLTDSKFFSITRPFTTLNCCSLPVAFSISSAGLQITQRMSSAALLLPCCLFSFLFSISCKWREKECDFFHMALGAIISSISVTSFIIREASDAQHLSLGLEQSPNHSLWPALTHTHTYLNILPQLNPVPQQKA